ncbi:DUF2125 domain-containing protein [Aliishimia ponticola]|nr:DUF2125 domain-containing protein [Aliishimia ponticola]
MRRLVTIGVGAALLFCLWWAGAAWWFNTGLTGWFDARRAEGWQAELEATTSAGFPARVDTVLEGIALADPGTGLAIEAEKLVISARTIWPGDLSVALPETPIHIATPWDRWTITAANARADLNLHPGTALQLEAMQKRSGPFTLARVDGTSVLGVAALDLALIETGDAAQYDLRFDVTDFTPGDAIRDIALLPPDWPLVFDVLTADIGLALDHPIDRTALETRRPQPQAVTLRRVEAHWGDMRFLATGDVIRDPQGRAEGHLVVKAENWQQMLDLAQAAGMIPPDLRPQIEGMLRGLASGTGRTEDLDVTLRFENGLTRIGFLPLGPAPSLVIR